MVRAEAVDCLQRNHDGVLQLGPELRGGAAAAGLALEVEEGERAGGGELELTAHGQILI